MQIVRNLTFLLISVGMLLLSGCSTDVNSPGSSSLKNFQDIAGRLERAYQTGSQTELDTVFNAWQKMIPPYTAVEESAFSDTIRHFYDVFRSFYSPEDLARITGGMHENFETAFRYVVIQNSLEAAVVDTNPRYFTDGTIMWEGIINDFRPYPVESAHSVVYLNNEADSMIYRHLFKPDGRPKSDHEQRVSFLRQAIQLTHHHWIYDYHKVTMPMVFRIYMNEQFTEALVSFRVFYQFGEAYLEKTNGSWNLIYSELRGIE